MSNSGLPAIQSLFTTSIIRPSTVFRVGSPGIPQRKAHEQPRGRAPTHLNMASVTFNDPGSRNSRESFTRLFCKNPTDDYLARLDSNKFPSKGSANPEEINSYVGPPSEIM